MTAARTRKEWPVRLDAPILSHGEAPRRGLRRLRVHRSLVAELQAALSELRLDREELRGSLRRPSGASPLWSQMRSFPPRTPRSYHTYVATEPGPSVCVALLPPKATSNVC